MFKLEDKVWLECQDKKIIGMILEIYEKDAIVSIFDFGVRTTYIVSMHNLIKIVQKPRYLN